MMAKHPISLNTNILFIDLLLLALTSSPLLTYTLLFSLQSCSGSLVSLHHFLFQHILSAYSMHSNTLEKFNMWTLPLGSFKLSETKRIAWTREMKIRERSVCREEIRTYFTERIWTETCTLGRIWTEERLDGESPIQRSGVLCGG